jgi:hypothetical protein
MCLQLTYSAYVLLHIQAPVSVSALQGVQTANDDRTLPLGTLESKHNQLNAMNTERYAATNGTSASFYQDQTFHDQLFTVVFYKALICTVRVPNKAPHYEDVWENGGIVPLRLNNQQHATL